ncbi:MAG: hypothetical protein MUF49_11615 [Oculatellaceae cyanobacterium Prado106]|jgi:hypothetical protein|nr:hypothetical protein [Oculatellaceae cyanobacterium Prado106]
MQITLEIPDELFAKLEAQNLTQILELGLNEALARPQIGFTGFVEVLDFLANLPSPEEVLNLRPSPHLQAEIDRLSEKYQTQDLTDTEQQLWQQYEYLEHVIRIAKAKAYLKLNAKQEPQFDCCN